MNATIELLQAVVLLLTFALQPNVPVDIKNQAIALANQAMITANVQVINQAPVFPVTPTPSEGVVIPPVVEQPATTTPVAETPTPRDPIPTVLSLTASTDSKVTAGTVIEFSWDVRGPERFRCTIFDGVESVPQFGRASVTATVDFTFTLSCVGERSASREVRSISIAVI